MCFQVRCVKETNKLRIYNTLAFFLAGGLLIVLSFMSPEESTACFIVLSIATGFLGLTTGGFFKNGPVLAQQYSQFVTGNVSQGLFCYLSVRFQTYDYRRLTFTDQS